MVRTIIMLIWFFCNLISRVPVYFKSKRLIKEGKLEERAALIDAEVAKWAAAVLRYVRMEVEVTGRENLPKGDEVVVFAANHQSYLDIPVLLSTIEPPPPLLARKEIGKIPFLALWMRELGCLFVDRDDARAAMATLKEAEQLVKGGRSLVVFPEGTRSKSDHLAEYQAGVVRIAWKAGVPIVPVAIDGSYRGLEGNGFRVKPAKIRLMFLPPVATEGLDRAGQKALPEALREMTAKAKGSGL